MLTALGFNEAVSISFIEESSGVAESGGSRLELLTGLQKVEGAFVTLSNPIVEGARLMRPSLPPGLPEATRNNFNHGTRDVRLFETGRVFAALESEFGAQWRG